MLAARDQENLVHGHQAAAAAKPLNQGTRQLAPRTPGNKVPKTPFKVSLNDENENGGFGGGKPGLKINGKDNENFMTVKKGGLMDKNAFATPMGPRIRAPLGMKTTNAKTKIFQTSAPPAEDSKTTQRSVSARKAKPRVSHAEMTKLEVLGDKDELEEREVEYMPPRPKNLPDHPDDGLEDLDLSVFENGGLMRGAWGYFMTKIDDDGLNHIQREERDNQAAWDRADRKEEARMQRDMDSYPTPCTHDPECPGEECKNATGARRAAEEQYKKAIASIEAEAIPLWKRLQKLDTTQRPSARIEKAAAATLSHPKQSAPASKPTTKPSVLSSKTRLNTSILSRPKKAPMPSNPSPMRHTAATATSRTTMGYSKGRAASATLRQTVLPKKDTKQTTKEVPDTSLPPADYISRYGIPRLGSEMWIRCKRAGCFNEDKGRDLEETFGGENSDALDKMIREEAMQDFQLGF